MSKPSVIAVHLLNDFSGSPLVFRQALLALKDEGYSVRLFTATPSGKGFLSRLPGIVLHPIVYRWSRHKWLTLFFFLVSQVSLFVRMLRTVRRADVVYINSMLPFGAALGGWLKGATVVYHIHEVSISPAALRQWLTWIINLTARRCIYVSQYVRQHTGIKCEGAVIYNALPDFFVKRSALRQPDRMTAVDTTHALTSANAWPAFTSAPTHGFINPARPKRSEVHTFTVLMLCSLKAYKGVHEFVLCARQLPELNFYLVLNASRAEIDLFFAGVTRPANLRLFDAQFNTHPFYGKADLVVNLSRPDQWVETFGMTVLEAMYYGRPVIVPPVGGVVELVENTITGFHADSRDIPGLVRKIKCLSADAGLYKQMSAAALARAASFRQDLFDKAVVDCFQKLTEKKRI